MSTPIKSTPTKTLKAWFASPSKQEGPSDEPQEKTPSTLKNPGATLKTPGATFNTPGVWENTDESIDTVATVEITPKIEKESTKSSTNLCFSPDAEVMDLNSPTSQKKAKKEEDAKENDDDNWSNKGTNASSNNLGELNDDLGELNDDLKIAEAFDKVEARIQESVKGRGIFNTLFYFVVDTGKSVGNYIAKTVVEYFRGPSVEEGVVDDDAHETENDAEVTGPVHTAELPIG